MRIERWVLVAVLLSLAVPVWTAAPAPATASQRKEWLDRFARGYFPGRSGQIFVVPRKGVVITEKDPLYRFMHGSPWDYDSKIPVLFYGAPFVRRGAWPDRVKQQDVAPTLGAMIGAPAAATYTGRVLTQVLGAPLQRPRIAVLVVMDAMRVDYFDRYAAEIPTLSRMRRQGAWFGQARSNVLPTVTGVGHATVGSGSDPRVHGITVNNLYNRVTRASQQAYDKLDPRELMALTLGDLWNLATDGRAIIIGQGGAIRATAGLVGRGACLINGRTVIAASYAASGDGGWETNEDCYRMSDVLKPLTGKKVWESAGGTWMGHDIASATKFRASALFQKFEAEALLDVMRREPLGEDDITDLVMVNMKGPDYTGHAYGPDSPEIRATLAELDKQMASLLALLEQRAGPNRSVVAITADHGMPPEPVNGERVYTPAITEAIHARFDPEGKRVVQYYEDAANNQLYIDTARLESLGFSLRDLAKMLESLPHFAAAFTEDDVRAAQAKLPLK